MCVRSSKLTVQVLPISGKNVVLVIIELRIDIDALALLKGELCSLSSVAEDVCTFVKIDGPGAAAENVDLHLIAHAVHTANGAAHQSSGSTGYGCRIKDGIVPIRDQCAGGGGAIRISVLGSAGGAGGTVTF